jgi:hypothetical protein
MFEAIGIWLEAHAWAVWGLVGLSVVMFVGSLVGLPWIIANLPRDFFERGGHWRPAWAERHPALRWTVRIGKSVLGAVLILAGVAMLALPGQGLLSIGVGLGLLEFPGKRRLIRWVGRLPRVRRGLDWLRGRMGRPPFL